MSSRRNRRQNHQNREIGTTGNQSLVRSSPPPVSQSVVVKPRAKTSWWKWIHENHQLMASYSALGGVLIAFVTLYSQWSQQKESDKQIEILRRAVERQHVHELAPRLLVDCPADRIKLSDGGQLLLQEAQMRIRNIGRGTAHHLVATVDFLRLHADGGKEQADDWKDAFPTQTVVAQKTLPSGESLPFTSFSYPLFKSTEPQSLTGTIAIYSVDDEGHEVVQTQGFMIAVHLVDGNSQARLDFMTPSVRPEIFALSTGKNERTFADVEGILKFVVKNEHARLKEFAEKNARTE